MSNFSAISWREQRNDDDVHFVLDLHAKLDIYSASSLKQQPMSRHVGPLTLYPDSEQTNHDTYSLKQIPI